MFFSLSSFHSPHAVHPTSCQPYIQNACTLPEPDVSISPCCFLSSHRHLSLGLLQQPPPALPVSTLNPPELILPTVATVIFSTSKSYGVSSLLKPTASLSVAPGYGASCFFFELNQECFCLEGFACTLPLLSIPPPPRPLHPQLRGGNPVSVQMSLPREASSPFLTPVFYFRLFSALSGYY